VESITSQSFLARHEFLIRRLHSLSGLLPVGGFIIIHLVTNSSILAGPARFQSAVDQIHSLGPILPLVEWGFIFLPIIFHAVVGVAIIRSGLSNTDAYPLAGNIRYRLQRVSAWIALIFIFYHVFHMHGWIHSSWWLANVAEPLGGAKFNPEHASSSAAAAFSSILIIVGYGIGILATVYHLANGLWTMGITWGLWITPQAQRRADYICSGFGILLAVVGLAALTGMTRVNMDKARAYEDVRLEQIEAESERIEEQYQKLEDARKAAPADAGDRSENPEQ
jgi:succinate dehydrogenase / fumarate reductase cytochrome b subunit